MWSQKRHLKPRLSSCARKCTALRFPVVIRAERGPRASMMITWLLRCKWAARWSSFCTFARKWGYGGKQLAHLSNHLISRATMDQDKSVGCSDHQRHAFYFLTGSHINYSLLHTQVVMSLNLWYLNYGYLLIPNCF